MRMTKGTQYSLVYGTLLLVVFGAGAALATELIINGDFEATKNGKQLRVDNKGQDWYESRKDGEGRNLLKLSKKKIGGNATQKAMIKGSLDFNTYFTQKFAAPQTGNFTVQYDIFVRDVMFEYDRSAFCFIGGIRDKKGGPSSTGKERFAFLGFENSEEEGKVNLFVREGSSKWADKTYVAFDLSLETWHTITLAVNVPDAVYTVSVAGVVDAYEVEAFYYKGKALDTLTHLSFASWNDGPGTFYIDNVSATTP